MRTWYDIQKDLNNLWYDQYSLYENTKCFYRIVSEIDSKIKAELKEVKEMETYEEMLNYCESNKEADGFCSICSACSGPKIGGYSYQYERTPKGCTLYTGGNYNSCEFYVKEE